MQTQPVDRRSPSCGAHSSTDTGAWSPDAMRIVQQGLQVQASVGTVGAVEFLKVRDVGAAVIRRVLTSHCVRAGDRALASTTPDSRARP
jgi:hypothetical protein